MRMWMVDPKWLCRKHLLWEHVEIHKHNFVKHHSIAKRVSPVVHVEPLGHRNATVDTQAAMLDLFARCPEYRERYSNNS